MKINTIFFFVLLAVCNVVHAVSPVPIDLQLRYGRNFITFVVNEDGTAVESREWSCTILKQTAVEWSKQTTFSYSTGAQKAKVIEAYTQKADGRRLNVPKDNYQVQINKGNEKDSPVYSDITMMTVVFPDVAVGDTVVLHYNLIQTKPMFPKHFSIAETFSDQIAYDDVHVRIDYPASLWVQYEAHKMMEKGNSQKDGRKTIEWTYANPKPLKNERLNYSVYDPEKEAGYAFSTFKTYADIATAYGARALPKAKVTERIQKLAAEIVKDKTSPRDQAHALYDWVATNITYAGNCIEIGAVVPRDLPFILDNKMGDCKDHATLLQALLAARGIESTQALLNAGPIYALPKIPVVSTVNHVINYIPSLDLYLDSTSDWTPFGMLPFQDQDKRVLLMEGFREGSKTPVPPTNVEQQNIVSVLKIAADGSMAGSVEVFQKGQTAAQSRSMARKMTKEQKDDFLKNLFRSWGFMGSGQLEEDDFKGLTDTFHYKTTFRVEKFTKLPGPSALYIYPLTQAVSILNTLQGGGEPEKEADEACGAGEFSEEYTIEIPTTMKVLSFPDDLELKDGLWSYSAAYRLKGNLLTVKRVFNDRTKGNVCSPQVMEQYKKFSDKVLDNLKAQILYK